MKKSKAKVSPKIPVVSTPPSGSALGWTFWSTAAGCWRAFFFRYILTFIPAATQEHFVLGTVYHALHEGLTEAEICSWGDVWEKALPEAKHLYTARLEKGPPLPKCDAVERTIDVPGLAMTTKPDREERTFGNKPMPRDFKTSGWYGKWDDHFWHVNGQIIGQMLGTGSETARLDLIHKRTGETKIIDVKLTEEKAAALSSMIHDLEQQLRARLGTLQDFGPALNSADVNEAFPPNTTNCVTKYGPCPFYARCWGEKSDPARLMFKESKNFSWAKKLDVLPMAKELSKRAMGVL